MIGIIGAMSQEINDVIQLMENVSVDKHAGLKFYRGILSGKEIVLTCSGVGKVNAAISAEAMVAYYNAEVLINTGVAGSLDASVNIGDIVISTDAVEYDMDVTALGYKRAVIPDMNPLFTENSDRITIFKADEKIRTIAVECCKNVNDDIAVFEGRVASGDAFIFGKNLKDKIVEITHAFCVEMEGASIAHTAALNEVPFLIIRAISDKADDSATIDYPSFQIKAIEHTVKLVAALVSRL